MHSEFEQKQIELLEREIKKMQRDLHARKTMEADLHIHDDESRIPDEMIGQMLKIAETKVTWEEVRTVLGHNGLNLLTITNHNNGKSCWNLLEKGMDILTGAEFTCSFPNMDLQIHVLTYGFDHKQERILNEKRANIFYFLEFCRKKDLPVILSHPTYFSSKRLTVEEFDILYLLFDRMELLNGQRSAHNNLLTLRWVESFDEEKIEQTQKRFGLSMSEFCSRKTKAFSGGSDDHFAIYAGGTKTILDISSYAENLPASQKALMAIREGKMAPAGEVATVGKQSIATLIFFFQMILHMEEPKLENIVFHKGTFQEKLIAVGISNIVCTSRKNEDFIRYIRMFNQALLGDKVNGIFLPFVPKDYQFLVKNTNALSRGYNLSAKEKARYHEEYIKECYAGFHDLFFQRLKKYTSKKVKKSKKSKNNPECIRIYSNIMDVIKNALSKGSKNSMVAVLYKKLSNPLFSMFIFNLALIRATKSNYDKREFREELALKIGTNDLSVKKTLWLTNSKADRELMIKYFMEYTANEQDYTKIDFLTTNKEFLTINHHVKLLKYDYEIKLNEKIGGNLKMFSTFDLHGLFMDKDYNNIICSMDITMGLASYFLQQTFQVPASLYISAKWVEIISYFYDLPFLKSEKSTRLRKFLKDTFFSFQWIYFDSVQDKGEFLEYFKLEDQPRYIIINK